MFIKNLILTTPLQTPLTPLPYLHYQHQESSFCPSSHSTHPLAPKPSLPATLGRSMTESLKNLQMSLKSSSVEAQAPRGGMGEDRGVGQQWGRRVGEDKFVKLQFPMGVGFGFSLLIVRVMILIIYSKLRGILKGLQNQNRCLLGICL